MSDEKPETPEQMRKQRLIEISRLPPDRRLIALKKLAVELARHERELQDNEVTTQQQASEAEELKKKSEEEVATLERLLPKSESIRVEDILKVTRAEAKKAEEKALEEQVQEAAKQAQKQIVTEHPYVDLHQRSNEELYTKFKDLRNQLRASQYTRSAEQEQTPDQDQRRILYEMQQIGQEAHYRGMNNQQQGKNSGMMSTLEEWASKYNT